jgi:hypothetical protein
MKVGRDSFAHVLLHHVVELEVHIVVLEWEWEFLRPGMMVVHDRCI